MEPSKTIKVAVVGCAHGELAKIYETLRESESRHNIKVDILLCCGDFQSVRNLSDLNCMACPTKFRALNTFYRYYNGDQLAPLTLFIGGNHEASNFLAELPYGGWVAPNIYYMGLAGVVNFGGIRIAALSGIFKGADYMKGHFEHPPYDEGTKRSAYHVRQLESFRLKQLNKPIDIVMSHDWPRGVTRFGDSERLFRRKPFFREEAERDELGSRPAQEVLRALRPKRWLSAHLHCRFEASLPELEGEQLISKTDFLALDKCLPGRPFFEILDVEQPEQTHPLVLQYDAEWLAILKSTDHLLTTTPQVSYMPGPGSNERFDFHPTDEEISEVKRLFDDNLTIPHNFTLTAPGHDDSRPNWRPPTSSVLFHNPQTAAFCQKLGVTDLNAIFATEYPVEVVSQVSPELAIHGNPDEISLDVDEEAVVSSSIEESATQFVDDENGFVVDTKGSTANWAPPAYVDQHSCQAKPLNNIEESAEMPVTKKFKRRNQEIYTAHDNTDADNQ